MMSSQGLVIRSRIVAFKDSKIKPPKAGSKAFESVGMIK